MFTSKQQLWLNRVEDAINHPDSQKDIGCKNKDGKYIFTSFSLCNQIIQHVKSFSGELSDKKILVVDTVEFIPLLLLAGAKPKNITFVALYETKGNIAKSFGVDVICDQIITWKTNMKFDIVIGNPPYQKRKGQSTNSEDLVIQFIKKAASLSTEYISFIMMSADLGSRSNTTKEFLLDIGLLELVNLGNNSFPGVDTTTCYWISDQKIKNKTCITDLTNTSMKFDLTKMKNIPLDDVSISSIIEKIMKFASANKSIGDKWCRGEITQGQAKELLDNNGIPCIFQCRTSSSLSPVMIKASSTSIGVGQHKVFIPGLQDKFALGPVKVGDPSHAVGGSVRALFTSSKIESENLKIYLETDVIKTLVRGIKSAAPNAKYIFEFIPEIDLSKPVTNDTLQKLFNLTDAELKICKKLKKPNAKRTTN